MLSSARLHSWRHLQGNMEMPAAASHCLVHCLGHSAWIPKSSSDGLQLCQMRAGWKMRKEFSVGSVVKHWNGRPVESCSPQPWRHFRHVDVALRDRFSDRTCR